MGGHPLGLRPQRGQGPRYSRRLRTQRLGVSGPSGGRRFDLVWQPPPRRRAPRDHRARHRHLRGSGRQRPVAASHGFTGALPVIAANRGGKTCPLKKLIALAWQALSAIFFEVYALQAKNLGRPCLSAAGSCSGSPWCAAGAHRDCRRTRPWSSLPECGHPRR